VFSCCETNYNSLELHNSGHSDIAGAIVDGYDSQYPTPQDAKSYPYTSHPTDTNWIFLDALAGDQQLVVPPTVNPAPVTMSSLSPIANAVTAGYLIAGQAYFGVSPVTKVTYTNAAGATETLTGAALARLEKEYQYKSGDLG
jgi:hypothetical protein